MPSNGILFFADRLPPLIGGMEMHGDFFIKYFSGHNAFPLLATITKDTKALDVLVTPKGLKFINLKELSILFNPKFIFFNSGRWIEQLGEIRGAFPKAIFLYRTGGNEILKASLTCNIIPDHRKRQAFWVSAINSMIDILMTNSSYTEQRLRTIGIKCPLKRFVGGVNTNQLKGITKKVKGQPLVIFCAARFVPYKNHSFLIQVIKALIESGEAIKLQLAGDGILLNDIKAQVLTSGITESVEFLGVLDNDASCRKIAAADVYMQLSTDYITEVQGGFYVHSEGMGRSILEAMSAGTFIIAGKSGALPEIVSERQGILVDLDSITEVVAQIKKVLTALPGKAEYTERYSWTNLFNKYEELLKIL